MEKIRVLAFDDNPDLREMIRLLLDAEDDMVCVAVQPDLSQLRRDLLAAKPDVIMMDIKMPGMDGIEGVRAVKAIDPHARILMQTVFEDHDKVFSAICAGASGYILKTARPEEMVQAIRAVNEGGSPMSPRIAAKVLSRFRVIEADPAAVPDYQLSDREKGVLSLMVEGRSYKMIAAELNISYHTVDKHIRSIYNKLHVSNGTEAVSKALKDRLV